MLVRLDGELLYKAYHDPETDQLDIVSSATGGAGTLLAIGDGEPGVGILCEPDGVCSSIAVERASAGSNDTLGTTRPEDCETATEAEVEVDEECAAGWRFDPTAGTLLVRFAGVEPSQWARIGASLLWLAIDAEARLAAVVFEGVSRDPGGRAQSAWLTEMAG